ncbi:MAG: hypothetical protein R3308_03630 [Thiohalobacterales bacterium]|nr:hypothetical protein [Thiohalobacterales bacterium]
MQSTIRLAAACIAVFLLPASIPAAVTQSVNDENGLRGWRLVEGDIEIELIQRLPDQTRAMFLNYEFSRDVIEQLAESCMFQTIIRNTGTSGKAQAINIDLGGWRMHHAGMEKPVLLKEPLLASWSGEDADEAARRVVQWGMFPTRQEFMPGDYNWGLTAYGIPPGEMFDLDVTWKEGGRPGAGRITGLVCAPDVERLK